MKSQWMILVLVKGGRDYITSQTKAVHTWYISGNYIIITTLYKIHNNLMIKRETM